MTSRRTVLRNAIPATALLLGGARAGSAEAVRLEETDPLALALGYKHDAANVDAKKFPAYAAGNNCGNCQLLQGDAGAAWGSCPAVGGKLVAATGWCAAWNKKA